MESKTKILIAVAVLFAVLVGVYWYLRPPRPVAPSLQSAVSQTQTPGAPVSQGQDLGSTLYEKVANPVQGKLPETVTPVPNPIDGVYKNPFD